MLIDNQSYRSSLSCNRRVRTLVLHYTAIDFSYSIKALTGESVSAHYLIPDLYDKSYHAAGFNDMRIFNLVDEQERAWHAGVSYWDGRTNINDTSIGIEIVNLAEQPQGKLCFPPYPDEQVEAIIALLKNILPRYPDISPTHVIGHSDIAIGRKIDPGPMFPWQQLYKHGIGAWYDLNDVQHYSEKYANELPEKAQILKMLATYGYKVSDATTKTGYAALIRAFQLHFRPDTYDGRLDTETAAILAALLKKYKNCP